MTPNSQNLENGANKRRRTGEPDYLSRIRAQYHTLTKSQRKIADYISAHPDEVLTNSITALSQRMGSNPPSLTRFFQALHYKGFGEFKFLLEKALVAPFGASRDVRHSDDARTVVKKLTALQCDAIGDTLLLLNTRLVARAAKLIGHSGRVHIYADGGPGASASFAYTLLLQIGIPCNFFTDRILAMMAAGQLGKGDAAIGITYSGTANAVLDALDIARKCGAATVGITAHDNSPLAKQVQIPLCYSLKIMDDLRYLHIARMCEVAILGVLQSLILNQTPPRIVKHIEFAKSAITQGREKKKEGRRNRKRERQE